MKKNKSITFPAIHVNVTNSLKRDAHHATSWPMAYIYGVATALL